MVQRLTDITQVPGIYAANAQDAQAGTGCTVIVCPQGATGGVDVRGGGPATRETDLLRPEEMVQQIQAVVLSGGSAFGLAASCGVAEELERRGIGFDVGVGVVPIVSSACLFDLACGDPHTRPDAAMGALACRRALDEPGPLDQGNFGAGTGCTVGKFAGPDRIMKSGLGSAGYRSGDLLVAAVSAVNACGNVVDPTTGVPLAGMLDETGTAVQSIEDLLMDQGGHRPLERTNTTISCVVTNARLSKAQATKLAQMSADAYAHAIRPTHTPNDGDTIFVLATGDVEAPAMDVLGALAVRSLEDAIVAGVRKAQPAYGLKAARDLA